MRIKIFTHNSLATGIVAIILGSLLAYFQKDFINLFLIAGGSILIATAIYEFYKFMKKTSEEENRWAFFPFHIVFLTIAGILLIVFPAFWVTLSEITIAVFVMVLALSKLMLLYELRKSGVKTGLVYIVLPILLLVISIAAISNPDYVLGSLSMVFGIMIIVFGLAEIIDYIIIHNDGLKKKFGALTFQDESGEVEESKEETSHEF